jgi:hypothetical protein
MRLLGGVDQEKEERERASRHRALFHTEIVDRAEEIFEGASIGIAVAAGACRHSQVLHNLECLLSFQPLDYASECGGEPTDILVKGDVFRASASGFRQSFRAMTWSSSTRSPK